MLTILKLKPNALRLLFNLASIEYKNYDNAMLRRLKHRRIDEPITEEDLNSERSKARRIHSALYPHDNSIWDMIKPSYKPSKMNFYNQDGAIYARWGCLQHPEQKGSIVYASTDPYLPIFPTKMVVSVYSNGDVSSFRSKFNNAITIWGIQTSEFFEIKGGRYLKADPAPSKRIYTEGMPMVSSSAITMLLFARMCYEQIGTEKGINWEATRDAIRSLGQAGREQKFESQFPGLILSR